MCPRPYLSLLQPLEDCDKTPYVTILQVTLTEDVYEKAM
jgi:hypothetical protein